MYRVIKKERVEIFGFTLVELLITIAIIGIISAVSVKSLYDIVTIRAKQQTIEDSSDSFRILARLITKSVFEARRVSIPNSKVLKIVGDASCQTIKYDPITQSVLLSKLSSPCTPPETSDPGFAIITNDDLLITNFSLSPLGKSVEVVLLEIEGYYKNSLGNHPLKYSTTMTPRI